jgi:hypothetical protein
LEKHKIAYPKDSVKLKQNKFKEICTQITAQTENEGQKKMPWKHRKATHGT